MSDIFEPLEPEATAKAVMAYDLAMKAIKGWPDVEELSEGELKYGVASLVMRRIRPNLEIANVHEAVIEDFRKLLEQAQKLRSTFPANSLQLALEEMWARTGF